MKFDERKKTFFTQSLLAWSKTHKREMPWKGEKDPYKVWLSEVILQQTRVSQGLPYYQKFVARFPTVFDLAEASEDEVLKLWQGLGYYSRARNLHHSAQRIVNEMMGKFPSTYDEILSLKGVGPYSAAAISSFAFQIPKAVVDGNVMRVLTRYFGIKEPIDSTEGRKLISKLGDDLIDEQLPGKYNQAIMDFGAAVCLPQNPLCAACPLSNHCTAFEKDLQASLPVKEKKVKRKNRYFTYLVMENHDSVFLKKRTSDDIWKGLYEFPMIEDRKLLKPGELKEHPAWGILTENMQPEILSVSNTYKHILTHQTLKSVFVKVRIEGELKSPFIKATRKNLDNFAFPKLIENYLKDNFLYLRLE